MRVLFVCSNNRDRSRTAEDMYKNTSGLEVKSCGVNIGAVQPVTRELVNWSDIIVVMNDVEDRQGFKLLQKFRYLKPMGKQIYDLEIPDKYTRDAPELMKLIKERMEKVPLTLA